MAAQRPLRCEGILSPGTFHFLSKPVYFSNDEKVCLASSNNFGKVNE